jgi:ABC-type transport system substrate-binding protein
VSKYDKIDDLIEKARMDKNEKNRLDFYYQIQKKLMEDVPSIPLMMMIYPIPYKSYLAGIAERDYIWGLDFYPFHFVGKK